MLAGVLFKLLHEQLQRLDFIEVGHVQELMLQVLQVEVSAFFNQLFVEERRLAFLLRVYS